MDNTKRYFHGVPVIRVAENTGFKYSTVYRHALDQKRISAESAMVYHRVLGIPLHELRPDLWPPADNEKKDMQEAADGTA